MFFVDKLEHRGQLGDLFGGINALFAGLAFAALVVAMMMQREELKLQREELEATRTEVKRQADSMVQQEKIMQAQREMLERQNYPSVHFELELLVRLKDRDKPSKWQSVRTFTDIEEFHGSDINVHFGRLQGRIINERPVPVYLDQCGLVFEDLNNERRLCWFQIAEVYPDGHETLRRVTGKRLEYGQAAVIRTIPMPVVSKIVSAAVLTQDGKRWAAAETWLDGVNSVVNDILYDPDVTLRPFPIAPSSHPFLQE